MRAVLYWKKREEETCGLQYSQYIVHRVISREVSLHLANNIVALCLFLLLAVLSLVLVLLQARITLTDDTLHGAELAGLLCDAHIVELRSISDI